MSRETKKPTKAQMQQNIVNHVDKTLKEGYIKNLVMGFEVANGMLLEYSKTHTHEELISFMQKNVDNRDNIERIVMGKITQE